MNSAAFVGSTIARAVAREFWLSGEQVTPCCVTYFENHKEQRWRLDYDDEELRWELAPCSDMPRPGTSEGDDEFRYPIVDLGSSLPIVGLSVVEYEEADLGDCARARLVFSSGSELQFTHWYDTDTEGYEYRAVA